MVNDSTRNNTGIATYTVDSFEVFMDPMHTVSETYEEDNNFTFTISADGEVDDASVDYVKYAVVDSEDGYIVEVAIDVISQASFKYNAGTILGFDIQFNDNIDGGGSRNHCLGWNDGANESWQNPSYLGAITLTDVKAEAPKQGCH